MNRDIAFYKDIRNIITQNILDISTSEVDNMYFSWEKNKDDKGLKTNFVYSDSLIHKNQKVSKNVCLKGIDLPTWFGNYNNKKIVVLGIDPLRSENVFKRENNSDIHNDVIVGTPYAFHERETRENWCASYWTFVNALVESNNFVYCTDIFKTYYFNNSTKIRSYLDPEFVNNSKHKEILIGELDIINPDLIIVFGKIAHKILLGKNCSKIGQNILNTKTNFNLKNKAVEVYTVLHLSKGTRGKNFKTFFDSNNIDIMNLNFEDRIQCAKKYIELFKANNII